MTYRLTQLILLVIMKWLADRNSGWNSDRRAKTKVFVQKMWKIMEKKDCVHHPVFPGGLPPKY